MSRHQAGTGTGRPQASLGTAITAQLNAALTVLQLVEAGKEDLDAPVRRYLPDFRLDDPRGAQITVRQNHTSGTTGFTLREESLAATGLARCRATAGAVTGGNPQPPTPVRLIIDLVLAGLTVVSMATLAGIEPVVRGSSQSACCDGLLGLT